MFLRAEPGFAHCPSLTIAHEPPDLSCRHPCSRGLGDLLGSERPCWACPVCGSGSLGCLFLIPGLVQATYFLAHLMPFCSPSSLNCFLFNPSPEIFESQIFPFFLLLFSKYLFIYLAAVGCGTWDRSLRCILLFAALGLSYPAACETLVPPPGGESASPALEGRFLTTGPSRKSPALFLSGTPLGSCL